MDEHSIQWEKRKRFFELYAKNLSTVKNHPRVHIEPDMDDIFVCPICFDYFTRDEVLASNDREALVTIEHLPPQALGGKERTLTCQACNNEAGYTLDSHLIHKLALGDFLEGMPGAAVDARIELNENIRLNATVNVKEKHSLNIYFDTERSNPKEIAKLAELNQLPTINMTFSGSKGRVFRARRPESALLRIAYLWAFSFFGYGFLINFNLKYIRGQIMHPENEILPSWGISSRGDFPDESLGVNIITEPKELASFLIVFDLKTPHRKIRYGVILPGPTEPGLRVYDWLKEQENAVDHSRISIIPIPYNPGYISDPNYGFISHEMWKARVNQPNHKM